MSIIELWCIILNQVKVSKETSQCIELGGSCSDVQSHRLNSRPFVNNSYQLITGGTVNGKFEVIAKGSTFRDSQNSRCGWETGDGSTSYFNNRITIDC